MRHGKVEKYTYLGQTISTNLAHEKDIRKGIEMGWRAFGKHDYYEQQSITLYEENVI